MIEQELSEKGVEALLSEMAIRETRSRARALAYTVLQVALAIGCAVFVALQIDTARRELGRIEEEKRSALTEKDRVVIQLEDAQKKLEATRASLASAELDLEQKTTAITKTIATLSNDKKGDEQPIIAAARDELAAAQPAPTPMASARDRSRALWTKGYAAYQAGRTADAQQLYEQASQTDPSYAAPLNSLGRIAGDNGHRDDEERLYRQALEKQPDYVPALDNMAIVDIDRGNLDEAEKLVRRALVLRPGYPGSTNLLKEISDKRAGR